MNKPAKAGLFLLLTILLAIGFYRLRISVDIFDLLPSDSLVAQGLRLYQNSFGTSSQLILAVQAPDADTAEQAAGSLAERIEDHRLSFHVMWRNPFSENPEARAELLAYFWFNQPPARFKALSDRLQGEALEQWLVKTKEQMAFSYQPEEIARLGYDPLALSQLPSQTALSALRSSGNPFASAGGKFRIMMVTPPFETPGFWSFRRWVQQVRRTVAAWQADNARFAGVTVRFTGTPAFVSETGSGLMSDMTLSAAGTLLFVAALFWLVYRRFRPLIWLAALLVFILLITIGLWGLFMGEVHAMSLGFAAILLGLAADYGLILYQEYRADPERSPKEHLADVAPSIFWAAGTTAAAFLILGRSSLPGMQQLGILVGGGILVAAVVMTTLYLQPLAGQAAAGREKRRTAFPKLSGHALPARTVFWLTLGLAAIALLILYRECPSIDYSTRNLGPKENPVKETLEEVQTRIGGFKHSLWIIVQGTDLDRVGRQLRDTARILDEAVQARILESYILPLQVWPDPQYQQENRETALQLGERLSRVRDAVLAAGFTPASMKLDQMVFDFWKRFATQEGVVLPTQPASQWVFSQFLAEHSGSRLALGRLTAAPDATESQLLQLTRKIHTKTGGLLFGWSLLSESLIGLIKRDAVRVLLPIGIIVLVLLIVAFRKIGEMLLSLGVIGFSLLCLLALMGILGWSWNLMNVMALPLLFGAGVDYSIHMQFALRRYGGELAPVRRTIGKAILLCGVSTASGFGSLAFASNIGLASLGRVCAAGILIIGLCSVFLLPAWWQRLIKVK